MPIDKFRLDTIITAYTKEDECPRKERMLSMTSEEFDEIKKKFNEEQRHLSIFTRPIKSIFIFTKICLSYINQFIKYCISNKKKTYLGFLILFFLFLFWNVPDTLLGPFSDIRNWIVYNVNYIFGWVILGIMSSVGLGTGLHTFLLFLGPHIIRVAITAGECDSTDFDTSIEWFHGYNLLKIINYSEKSFQCKINPLSRGAGFWQILQKVEWSCLLWGAGTAIGELPPYFVARQARLSGEKISELNELNSGGDSKDNNKSNNNNSSLMTKLKKKIYDYVQNFGFFAILIFASIPNPLFDLAGLTCGHFLIPFWTFFGATLIGKSIIKSNIQAMFYISLFNRVTLEYISSFIDNYIPIFKGTLKDILNSSSDFAMKSCLNKDLYSTIEKCSACCDNMLKDKSHQQRCYDKCKININGSNSDLNNNSSSSWLSSLWELFITFMILYFLVSIINSMVKESEANRYQRILSKMSENVKDANSISPILTSNEKQIVYSNKIDSIMNNNSNSNNSGGSVSIIINDTAYRRVKTPGTNCANININNNAISPSDIIT